MKFTKIKPVSGTSLVGNVWATFDELERVFGKPTYGPDDNVDDKVTCEWNLKFSDGTIATVYDWREYRTPRDRYEWHVGGMNRRAVDRVMETLESSQVVSLNLCEFDKQRKVLKLKSDHVGMPVELYIESHITGRTVKFVQLGESDPLFDQDMWDGEMCIYRPVRSEAATNVDHLVIYNC